ncbi:mitochondrial import receptor subunit Tom22 [Coemansia sp. RSA 2399]|nr:mitochondrial import receptor subunit Tom22 [Coemansia sp. RSA 2399]KAJ1889587.1 mitochondrial import receptor subunit Tom22 [Coemansia sp. IMI 209127]
MVKVVEIEDNSDYETDSQYTTDNESVAIVDEKDEEYSGDESEYSNDDSEFDDEDDSLDESLLERLAALKDIVPASQRNAMSSAVSAVTKWGGLGATLAGKLAWVFTTTALLVVFPLAYESDREKMMEQWASENPDQANGIAPPQQQQQGQMMAPGVAPGLA